MAGKTKSLEALLIENEELKLRLAAKETIIETFRESENKYSAVYNSMSEGLAIHELIYDKSGKAIDYVITDVNPAYERIIGLKKKKAIGFKATEVYKVSPAPYLDVYSEVALTGDPQTFETFFPPLNKHFYISIFSPEKGKFATVFQDITARKQAEVLVRESEERFRTISETAPVLVCVTRMADNIVLFTNEVNNKAFGLRGEDIIGTQGPDYYCDPDDRCKMIELFKKQGFVNNYQLEVKKTDGTPFWIMTSVKQISYYGEPALIGASIDITERIQNEHEKERLMHEIESQAAWLDASISSMATGIILYSLDSKAIRMNETAKKLLPEELIFNMNIEERSKKLNWETEDGKPFPVEEIPVYLALKGETTKTVILVTSLSGHKVFLSVNAAPIVDSNGKILGVVASFLDITERKKNEVVLREGEERYHQMFDRHQAIGLLIEPETGAIIDANPAALNYYGYSLEQICSLYIQDINQLPPDEVEAERKKALKEQRNYFVFPHRLANGEMRWVEVYSSPLSSNGRQLLYSIIHDITARKNAEESLRVSEERFSRAFKNSPNAITITRLTDGKIIDGNDSAYELLGYNHEEVVGKTSLDLGIWANATERSKLSNALATKGSIHNEEFILSKKDGTSVTVNLSASLLTIDNQQCFICSFIDLTERKKAEEALKESEKKFYTVFNSAPVAMSIAAVPGGEVIDVNKAWLDLVKINLKEEILGKNSFELGLIPDAESRSKILNEFKKKGFVNNVEITSSSRDGGTLNLLVNVHPVEIAGSKYMLSTNSDITALKNADKALRISEERLRVTLSSIGDAVIAVDTSGKINFLNPVAVAITGWKPVEAEGQPVMNVFRIINEITQNPAVDIVQQVLHEGRVIALSNHTSLVTKEGRHIPIEDSAAPIKDQSGNVIGVVLVFHDVTEKRKAQEALSESEERFRNLVKNAPTAIYEIDFTTRKLTSVNDSMCQLSGYTRDELLLMDSLDLLEEESKQLFISRIQQSLKGEKPAENVEYKVKAKDGRLIDAVLNMKFNINERGIPVSAMVVGHDITERKKAENEVRAAGEALRVSEKRFRTLAENIPDMIVRFDKDLRLLYGNEAVLKRTGQPIDFLTGKTAKEYGTSSESDQNWESAAREVLRTGAPCRVEQANSWLGTLKVYDALIVPEKDHSGNVNSIISIARDVTDLKKTERILRTSEQRLKYHFENSPLAVVEWDKEFNIIQWSNEAERIFGYTKDETIGVRIDFLNIIYTEDIPLVEKTMSRLTNGKEVKVVSQNRNLTKTGDILECIWYNSVLMDENGEMSSVMSLIADVTILRKTERELIASQENYKELVTNARSMILKLDNDANLTFINEFALDFFGYKEGELLGKSVMIIVPETESTGRDLNVMVEDLIEDPDIHAINVNENIKKNGEKVWVEWHNKTLFDESGRKTGHIAIGIDITIRKIAEDALMESESKFRSVLNAAKESIYMFDNDGHIIMTNITGIARLNKTTEEEVIGHSFSEFMTTELANSRKEKISSVFSSGLPMEYEDIRVSRSYFHSFYPVFKDSKVQYVVSYSTDITERKKAEQSLIESEERFRTIAESITVMVVIKRTFDSRISFVNDPFSKSFGFTKEDLVGSIMPDIYYYPEDNKFLHDLLRIKGMAENMEVKVKRHDGSSFWILTSFRQIIFNNEPSYLMTSIDISETKRAQEELLRLNRTLDAQSKSNQALTHATNEAEYLNEICKVIIEDCGHSMVWIGYAQNDNRKSVKPVAHFGFDKGYIDQMNITWDESPNGNGPTGITIKTGKPTICRNMLTDPCFGPWRDSAIKRGYAASIVLPLKSEGKVFGAISIYSKESDPFSDSEIDLLTELADDLAYGILFIRLTEYEKEAASAIRENEVRLKELIATKDKFFNIIAHDLKNPFTSLLGASELLYDNIDQMTSENIKKLALILNDSSKSGYSILQNLLDWSRSQTGQLKFIPENENLKAIIDENIDNLQLQVTNKEIDLKSELNDDLFITADKNMINTVLRNLLSNAVKYTFKNGIIRVTVASDKGKITLTVKDTGIGISKEKADSLFKLENSLSLPGTAKEQGTGLGLKLCKEFTEKMGGRIWVESEIGKGSEFKFTIPINGTKA